MVRSIRYAKFFLGSLCSHSYRNPPSAPLIEQTPVAAPEAKDGQPQLRVDDWSTLPPESTYFLQANRGKRSVTVNLKNKEGLRVVHELVKKADVLVRPPAESNAMHAWTHQIVHRSRIMFLES